MLRFSGTFSYFKSSEKIKNARNWMGSFIRFINLFSPDNILYNLVIV